MREYGQIQCSFWSDTDIQALSDQAKLLAAYLLTGPHSNGIGCYRLPDGYVQADFGWTSETVSKGFAELFQIGFCKRCERTDFVLIPKFLKWNPVANANVAKARQKEYESVSKKSSIYNELSASLLRFGNHWANPFETLLKGLAKQDPNQTLTKPENILDDPEGPSDTPAKHEYPQAFEKTWAAYPKRHGGNPKHAALNAWRARQREGHSADEIHAGVVRYSRFIDATGKQGTEFVQQAKTFFGTSKPFLEPWDTETVDRNVWRDAI